MKTKKTHPQPEVVVLLAQKLLKAAGKQDPVVLMNALLMCMQTIDIAHNGIERLK